MRYEANAKAALTLLPGFAILQTDVADGTTSRGWRVVELPRSGWAKDWILKGDFSMRRNAFLALTLLLAASPVWADDWAKEMFDHTDYDFGTIARGAKAEHHFTLKNVWVEDVHVLSVTSSCGCTAPSITKETLKSFEQADIVAAVDTRTFMGHKEAAITVKFDRPFNAELVLNVSCYIRSDVVVQPGSVTFDAIPVGTDAEKKIKITYAGRDDWEISSIETSNPHLKAQFKELERKAGNVHYEVAVQLDSKAPAGYLKDQLTLITNDPNAHTSHVPVPVEGQVVAPVSARPSPLVLGVVAADQPATGYLVLQGKSAFKVTRIHCADRRFQVELPAEAKAMHLLPVVFRPGSTAGNVNETLHIETDAGGSTNLDVRVQVRVMGAQPANTSSSVPAQAAPSRETRSPVQVP